MGSENSHAFNAFELLAAFYQTFQYTSLRPLVVTQLIVIKHV